MAGDEEELSLLLSSIPSHSQETEINNLLFSVQHQELFPEAGDMITQLLSNEEFYTSHARPKERSVSLSVSSPESGLGSDMDAGMTSPGAGPDTPMSLTLEPSQVTTSGKAVYLI